MRCKGSLSPTGIYLDAAGLGTILPMIWTSIFGGKKAILATTYVGRPTKEILEDLISLKELVEEEKIQPVIDRRYLLEETAEAYRYVETGRKKGNVIITVEYNNKTYR
jgi:NADPH:quinone reductase-like Zn-dependent oxidoreductase